MRGEVEIWRGDDLILTEPNMIVDGAGVLLADIMTVSRSLSGVEDHATSSILDTSNYTIQAISFGKDLDTFSKYAHTTPYVRNINYVSTFSSTGSWGKSITGAGSEADYILSSRPDITNPPGFEDVPSSVAHVVHAIDKATDKNIVLTNIIELRSPQAGEWDIIPSGFQDKWWCHSLYIKKDTEEYPPNFNAVADPSIMEMKLVVRGPDEYTAGGSAQYRGIGRDSTLVNFNLAGEVSSSEFSFFTVDQRNNVAGFAETDWKGMGGVQDIGNGWYRVWTSCLAPSGADRLQAQVFPAGFEDDPLGDTSGGLFIFGQQIEAGKWPSELQYNDFGRKVTAWDLSASPLSQRYEYGDGIAPTILDKGTVRVVTDPSSTAFSGSVYVENFLGEGPSPMSTRLESSSTVPSAYSDVFTSNLDFGQNPNYIPYRSWSSIEYNFSAYDEDLQYVKNISSDITTYSGDVNKGELGNVAYFLGCYPEGSSTGGSTYALVSSLDSSTAYANQIHTGTYNGTFNEASSMDHLGFVNMIMSAVPNGTYAMSSTASGLCVSAPGAPQYQAPPFLEYSVTIGSGDAGYSNLYGGITKMAMWTIDVPESLKAGNTPPYAFRTLDNPRKYRMFCTKHLLKNICYITDNNGDPGADQYEDLLIKWRLHFL
jgi:hypothetical protein